MSSNGLKWQFWCLWVLASAVAGTAVSAVARSAAYSVGYAVGETGGSVAGEAALGIVALGGFMTTLGLAQWLVVVRHLPWAGWWLLGSAAGGVVCGATMLGVRAALLGVGGEAVASPAGVGAGLTSLAVVQWLILRGRAAGAVWLAAATVLGLVAAAVSAGCVGAVVGNELAGGAAFGAGYGVVTGGVALFIAAAGPNRCTSGNSVS